MSAFNLSKEEKAWNRGWTCDLCTGPIDLFNEPTMGREADDENKISRHAQCHIDAQQPCPS